MKGYDSNLLRKNITKLNLNPVIPGRRNRKEKVVYDQIIYTGRHVVENPF